MKKKKHKRLRRLIRECEDEIENLRTLPYYRIFKRQAEQEADLKELQLKIKSLKSQIPNNKYQTTNSKQQITNNKHNNYQPINNINNLKT
jgi:hypothetical protein